MLFHGHSELIEGFNTFLPPGYRIEILSDTRQDVITVTTPMGVLTQMSDGSIGRLIPPNPPSLQPPPVAVSSPIPSNLQLLSDSASNLRPAAPQFVQLSLQGDSGPAGEFNRAIQYLKKIKRRYADDQGTYRTFLEILQTYQKEQRHSHDVRLASLALLV